MQNYTQAMGKFYETVFVMHAFHATDCQGNQPQDYKHIEAETEWPPFTRRHFQMHFLEWKCMNFDWNFTEVYL